MRLPPESNAVGTLRQFDSLLYKKAYLVLANKKGRMKIQPDN
jgi:hypothetical protein